MLKVKFCQSTKRNLPESWTPDFKHNPDTNPDQSWEPEFSKTEKFQAMDFDEQVEKVKEEATKLGVDGKIKAKGEDVYISVFEESPVVS